LTDNFSNGAAAQRRAGALFSLGDGEFLLGSRDWGLMIRAFPISRLTTLRYAHAWPLLLQHKLTNKTAITKRALISSPGKLT
jgi:hypothetical protein